MREYSYSLSKSLSTLFLKEFVSSVIVSSNGIFSDCIINYVSITITPIAIITFCVFAEINKTMRLLICN